MSTSKFSLLSLLLIQILICFDSSASEVSFSYTYGAEDFDQMGSGKAETYDIAIRLADPSLTGAKIKSFTVPFVTSDGISNISVWVSNELILENKVNRPNIASVEAACIDGKVSVTFPQMIEIPAGGVYVGYTFTVDHKDDMTMKPVIVAGEPVEDGLYMHTNNTYLKWKSYSSYVGHSSAITVTLEGGFQADALGVVSVKNLTAGPGQASRIETTLVNHGSNPISNISYEIEGVSDSNMTYEFTTPLDLYFGQTATVELPFVAPLSIDEYPFRLKIKEVNGVYNHDVMNSGSATLVVMDEKPVHRPLMEEYTGFWCGYCPRGFAALERMNALYPEEFVAISYHSDDVLQATNAFPTRVDGLPAAVMDRKYSVDAYFGDDMSSNFGIESFWNDLSEEFTPAFVSGEAEESDDGSITVRSDVSFILSAKGRYKVAYAIIANGIHDKIWGQTNYYSGVNADDYVPEMAKFCNGDHVVYGLVYDDVFAAGSDLMGEDSSLIENVVRNTVYSNEFRFGKDDGVSLSGYSFFANAKDLYAVIILLDENGAVVNTGKVQVQRYDSGVNETPFNEVADVVYYDMNGYRVFTPFKGMFVKVVTMKDGSRSVSKITIP